MVWTTRQDWNKTKEHEVEVQTKETTSQRSFSPSILLEGLEFESHTDSQQQKVTTLNLDTNRKPTTKLETKHRAWKHQLKTQEHIKRELRVRMR